MGGKISSACAHNSKTVFFGYILDVFSLCFTKFRATKEEQNQTKRKTQSNCKRKQKTSDELVKYLVSFKIFHHFWLVKTTRIIHHTQLLLTKLGENCHIEPMTSKVLSYWTNDVKLMSKVQPTAGYWTINPGFWPQWVTLSLGPVYMEGGCPI